MSKNTQAKLDELKARIMTDNPTPQLAKTALQLVFGSGDPEASIMFIGEAPGKKEDEQGEPFVGAAGKMLNELMQSIGLQRKHVYITNIVKYRPPENRDPLPAEKNAFWPYLLEQVAIIKPKVVATLGRHSGQAFYPDLRIGVDHGSPKLMTLSSESNDLSEALSIVEGTTKVQGKTSFIFLPLYHPAAALYNGSLRATLAKDFAQLAQYA
jgi:DNA polymerase